MKRIVFTSLVALGMMAGLVACSGDPETPAKKEISKRNDLEVIESSLTIMKSLDAADSSVRSIPVQNLDVAKQIFRCIVAESCTISDAAKTLNIILDDNRLVTANDGRMEYQMSNHLGEAQGSITLVPMTTPEKGILAYAEVNADGPVKKLEFVDKSAWPENGLRFDCKTLPGLGPTICGFLQMIGF